MKTLKVQIPGTPDKDGTVTIPVSKSSDKFSLNLKDVGVGLLMAVGTATGPYIYDAIMLWFDHKEPNFDLRTCLKFAFSATIMYVGRKYFQQGQIVINKKELQP